MSAIHFTVPVLAPAPSVVAAASPTVSLQTAPVTAVGDTYATASLPPQHISAVAQLKPTAQRLFERAPAEPGIQVVDPADGGPVAPPAPVDDRVWFSIHGTTRESRTLIEEMGGAIEYVEGDLAKGTATQATLQRMLAAGMNVGYELLSSERLKAFPDKDAAYHDYNETTTLMRELVAQRPDLVSLFSIGKTVEGKDIWALRFKQGTEEKPGVLFVGSHHAREHLSTEIPLLLAEYLVKNANDPEVAKLLAGRDITIIPMLNVDGAEYDHHDGRYHMWRKSRVVNRDGTQGVDLNRNYDGPGWGGKGSSGDPGSETYRGPKAFSEPETVALKQYIESHPNIKVLLSYHTFSELVLYPWGHTYDPIADQKELAIFKTMAEKMAKWTGYKAEQSSDLYITTGDTTDWAWAVHGIYAFTIELSPRGQSAGGFYPGDIIGPTFERNIRSALFLIDVAADPASVLRQINPSDTQ